MWLAKSRHGTVGSCGLMKIDGRPAHGGCWLHDRPWHDILRENASLITDTMTCRKQLRHSEIMWFDENFLAVLLQQLGDVRSMFGFGSGRGDFERWFYEQVDSSVLNDLSARVLYSGNPKLSGMHSSSDRELVVNISVPCRSASWQDYCCALHVGEVCV